MSAAHKDTNEIRLALLEQTVSHIYVCLEKMDKRLDRIEERIDQLNSKIDSNFKWVFGLYIGGFSALFGIMAHGFQWL